MSVTYLQFTFILCMLVGIVELVKGELCAQANSKCVSRIGCGMALNNYYINCGVLIHGRSAAPRCTPECKKALISLLSTEDGDGEALMTCDCDGNEFCMQQKQRMSVCNDEVLKAMKSIYNHSTQISCSLAELICSADTSCVTALRFYNRHCSKLFTGDKCTPKCNNSLAILYRQAKAQKLRTCQCDGSEKWKVDCRRLQAHTGRLCFQHSRHNHRPGNGPRSHSKPPQTKPTKKTLYRPYKYTSGTSPGISGSLSWILTLLLALWHCR